MAKAFTTGGSSGKNIDPAVIQMGYKFAGVPNPGEGSFYNIPNDAIQDQFVKYFDTDNLYSFWAPVVPPDEQKDPKDVVIAHLQDNFTPPEKTQFSPQATKKAQDLFGILVGHMQKYTDRLKTGNGENGEGINVARIEDPFQGLGTPRATQINLPPEIFMQDPKAFRTSWNAPLWGDRRKEGRVGYSVKFISFKNLVSKKLPTNGQATSTNAPDGDGEAMTDLPLIQH
jgi:hypothetical protein